MTRTERALAACALLVLLAPLLIVMAAAQDSGLLEAVRRDDCRGVETRLKTGTDPNARGEIGATAVMHAAAFASLDCLRLLLDGRADVNASSTGGATALIWATGDAAKVRLLLDRGAAADAAMKDGTTALLAAARRGNLEVIRLLLARGADRQLSANGKAELLRIADGRERPDLREMLAAAGVDLPPGSAPTLANYPMSNAGAIGKLLDKGASPDPRGRFPLVGTAAFQGQLATLRLLLDRGANPNAPGQRAVTPLMMAAAAPVPDTAIVRVLIEKGADQRARDQVGRTALDWASLQGDTPVARLLRELGTPSGALAAPPRASSARRTTRTAVAAALPRLQSIGPALYTQGKCVSCHHQFLPAIAMTVAANRGIAADGSDAALAVRSTLDVWNSRREGLMAGREVGGGANELTYGLLMLSELGVARSSTTDVGVASLISLQRVDGSWVFFDTRPPQADNSPIHFTAMAIRGLDKYGPPGLRQDIAMRIARARDYLRSSTPSSTQDEAFKLLGFVWSGVLTSEITSQGNRLIALQRADGGWAQLPTMAADAYATGQALYALRVAGTSPTEAVYRRAVAYLLSTQLDDGTWFVRSRAFGFQPYFESGFPHGVDQFISASATAWATIALAYAL